MDTLPATAPPTFTPGPGAHDEPVRVEIYSPTPGAAIYFTTNGETPTSSGGMKYDGTRVPIASTTTLKAIAIATGYSPSTVTVGNYVRVIGGALTPPSFNPVGGTYASTQSVTVTAPVSGAFICYTFAPDFADCDDSKPDAEICVGKASKYVAPIMVAPSATGTTLRAVTCKWGYARSAVTSATYALP